MLYQNRAPYSVYGRIREAVDESIRPLVRRVEPPELRDALHQATLGGKRVRSILTMLSCSAVGGNPYDALPAAAALEILHTSSLVHDDIMDSAPTRRGIPSIHKAYGNSMAILAGDTLVALAFRLMQELTSPNKERVMCRFVGAFLHICEGQGFDLVFASHKNANVCFHKTMVEKKTAMLMAAAAAIGAMVGTESEEHIRALDRFGFELGMAFQAKDDVLDQTGDERSLGKLVGADRRNGKVTFLNPEVASRRDLGTATVDAALDHASEYTRAACFHLDVLPPTPAREHLRAFAEYLLVRED